RDSPSGVARSTPSTARTSPKCLLTARVSTVARSNQPLLLPLAEDTPAGRVGFLERLLGRGRAAGRLGEHDVQHPGAEDLVDGRVGVAGVADVGGPAEDEIFGTWVLNRSEEHTSELQSRVDLVCRLLLEKKKNKRKR